MTRQTGPARLDPSPAARHGDTPAVTGRRRDQLRAAATPQQAGRVTADGGAR